MISPVNHRSIRYEYVDRIVRAWAWQAGLEGPLEPVVAATAPDATPAERRAAAAEVLAVFGLRRLDDGRHVVSGRPHLAPPTPLDLPLEVVRAAIAESDRYLREIESSPVPAPKLDAVA